MHVETPEIDLQVLGSEHYRTCADRLRQRRKRPLAIQNAEVPSVGQCHALHQSCAVALLMLVHVHNLLPVSRHLMQTELFTDVPGQVCPKHDDIERKEIIPA